MQHSTCAYAQKVHMLLLLPLIIISCPVLYSVVEIERRQKYKLVPFLKTVLFFFFFFVWQGSDSKQKCVGKSSDL